MFDNIQHADEYACSAAIQKDTNKLIMDNIIQDDKHLKELRQIVKDEKLEKSETRKGKKYCIQSNWTYCYIHNNTYFCESCARKLKYKCPVCGGLIKKERSR
jgi:hypothetical protein